ncbi:MAG: ABC transporter ATP-binding protein, partial [Lentisphaeria bacterium]|nr:ABC transporter ATP-binding protein [Lentisphaeria bacterium]
MRLEIDGITKRFGRTVALDNVSFSLDEPGIHGFIGPNGAGKTTLLRILAGFDDPDSGDAVIDGVSRIEYPERFRRRIGFMPDTLPSARDVVVKEYVDFYARAFGLKGSEKAERVRRVCELTQLDGMLKKTLSALSKGMKQRVLLARLLIHDPEFMLLDEPAAGLDPRARIELRDTLLELAKQGKTILLSSHILGELEDMVSGLVILEKGRLVSAGKLTDITGGTKQSPQEELDLIPAPGVDAGLWADRL